MRFLWIITYGFIITTSDSVIISYDLLIDADVFMFSSASCELS